MDVLMGVVMLAAGSALGYLGWSRRQRVLALRRAARSRGESGAARELAPQMAIMAEIVPPLVSFALVIAGAKAVFAYMVMGGVAFASPLALVGFLGLLAGYGTWLRLTTRYRLPAAVRSGEQDGDAQAEPQVEGTAPARRAA